MALLISVLADLVSSPSEQSNGPSCIFCSTFPPFRDKKGDLCSSSFLERGFERLDFQLLHLKHLSLEACQQVYSATRNRAKER